MNESRSQSVLDGGYGSSNGGQALHNNIENTRSVHQLLSRVVQLEGRVTNVSDQVNRQSPNYLTEAKVMALVAEEANAQNKIINENLKANLLIQKKEGDGLVRRLGINIQDALVKIKNDLKYESRENVEGLEARTTRKM